jgi:hypothetical protein
MIAHISSGVGVAAEACAATSPRVIVLSVLFTCHPLPVALTRLDPGIGEAIYQISI